MKKRYENSQRIIAFKLFITGLITLAIANKSMAATVDWKGATSSNWATGSNWSSGSAPASGDAVRIGVVAFTNQPTISSATATTIASLTFGTSSAITLTVNSGFTLTVTGAISQNPSNSNYGTFTTTLAGAGSISCASLNVGDNSTLPPLLANNFLNLVSTIASLSVTGNVTVNSTNYGVLISFGYNNATFSLQGGTTSIGGTILTANTASGVLPLTAATPTFSIDMPTGSAQTPVLQLSNTAAINTASVAGSINFYNNTGGTGTCTVDYINNTGATQTVYTSTTAALSSSPDVYQYLQLTGSGSQTSNGGNLTVADDVTSSSSAVYLNTNNPTVTVGDSWTNSSNVTQGSGNITVSNALQNTAGTFQLGTGNLTTSTLQNSGGTVAGGAGPGVVTVSGTFQNDGGTYQCGAENDYFNGLYQNTSTFTAGTGTVYFNGSAAQTLSDLSSAGTQFNNVSFSGTSLSNAKTMSGSGGFAVSATGVLYMVGSTTKLDAGGVLTLISGSTSSATVSAITSGSTIINSVEVQRYITGGAGYRGYRLISSPVYAATVSSNNVCSINYLDSYVYLTGTSGGGFDKTGNPTLYLYREDQVPSNATFISGNFEGISAINNSPTYTYSVTGAGTSGNFNIPVGNGVMFFFRGNRASAAVGVETVPGYTPVTVTTSTTGTLNQGQVIVHDWYTPASANLGYTGSGSGTNHAVRGFNLVGNPYASSIDWEQYNTSTTTTGIYANNVGNTIYELDPATNNYDTYQKGGTYTNHGTRTIVSGQGFFVLAANSTSPQLIFNESAKTTMQNSGLNLFMATSGDMASLNSTTVDPHLRLQMAMDSINTDDMYIGFNSSASSQYVFNEDAPYKAGNGQVKLASFSNDNIMLAINKMPLPGTKPATVPLFVNAAAYGAYKLNMAELEGIPQLYDVWLMDRYIGDSLDMRHNATYAFDITADTNSYGSNRFQLVIRQNPALGVHLLSFTASKATSGAQVLWTTDNEANYTNFTVERSTDNGVTFDVLGGFVSSSTGTYSYLDKNPVTGADQYRLKIQDLNSAITYSNAVTLVYGNGNNVIAANINVYPNPASSVINLAINQSNAISVSGPAGLQLGAITRSLNQISSSQSFDIRIVNITGATVMSATTSSPNWQNNVGSLAPGTYIIQVVNKSTKTEVGKNTFVKL